MEVEVEESENFSFSVDTKGLCLLCLIKVEPEWQQSMSTCRYSAESFQCLSRYLEVDLYKILNVRKAAKGRKIGEGFGLEGPQLKVNLCEGCTLITEKFSELCQQLRECLKIIQMKLVDAEEAGLIQLLGKSEEELKPRRGRKRKLGSAEGLRNEIMGKCSGKLSLLLPPRPYSRQLLHMTPRSVDPEPYPLLESPPRESSKSSEENIDIIGKMRNKVKANVEDDLIEDDDWDDNKDKDDEDWNQDSEFSDDSRQSHDLISSSGISDNDDDFISEEEGDPEENSLEAIKSKSASSPSNRVKKKKQAKKQSRTTINPETGKYRCGACPKEFSSSKAAGIHHKSVHLKIKYLCMLCDKNFSYKRTLNYHIRDKHSGADAPLKCCKCGETFTEKSDLKEHKKTSSCWTEIRAEKVQVVRTKSIICDICQKTFYHPSRLKRHMETVHLKLRNFCCDQCGKGFSTPDHLKRHVSSIHLNLKDEHLCTECGKGFRREDQLKTHIKSVHLKERDYICDQCGKGYPYPNSLQKHIQQVHLRVRDYACDHDLCQEKFHSKHQLNSHRIRVHLGRKRRKRVYVSIPNRYRCNHCEKGFTRNNDLTRHIKTVHLQLREFVCHLCVGVTFKRKKSLVLHRTKFHSETGNGPVKVRRRKTLAVQ